MIALSGHARQQRVGGLQVAHVDEEDAEHRGDDGQAAEQEGENDVFGAGPAKMSAATRMLPIRLTA